MQPRKQRKYVYNAPFHIRHKLVSAHLSKELIKKYKTRSFPLKKGDEVEVMRGGHKKKTGTVNRIDLKDLKVYIEGIKRKRVAGTEVTIAFHPSNLKIINLNLSDKKRLNALNRRIKEDKHGKASQTSGSTKVLESATKAKTVGSETKTRTA